ncbi:MAG: hypothetical protein NC826_01360 [Candidatus Omnitrophica bacterium]|nr:hypothetical protein [Candidatus Omnitrophota bacterium]
MSTKQKIQIKLRQRLKRRKLRERLFQLGYNPNEYFYGKYLVKELPKTKTDAAG